jgi:hypothetical protein
MPSPSVPLAKLGFLTKVWPWDTTALTAARLHPGAAQP